MNWKTKLVLTTIFVLILSLSVSMMALAEAATYIENTTNYYDQTIFVHCAAGGAGEDVRITGTVHEVLVFTVDENGGFHGVFHAQPMGIKAVGQTTGDIYQATGVSMEQFNNLDGYTDTIVESFKIIGPGPGNNFVVQEVLHLTENANGEVTAFVDYYSYACK